MGVLIKLILFLCILRAYAVSLYLRLPCDYYSKQSLQLRLPGLGPGII